MVDQAIWTIVFSFSCLGELMLVLLALGLRRWSQRRVYQYVAAALAERIARGGMVDSAWLGEVLRRAWSETLGGRIPLTFERAGHIANLALRRLGAERGGFHQDAFRRLRRTVQTQREEPAEDRLLFFATHPFPLMLFVNGALAPVYAAGGRGIDDLVQIVSCAILLPVPLFAAAFLRSARGAIRAARVLRPRADGPGTAVDDSLPGR